MRWRLIVLGGLAVAFAIACVFCSTAAVDLSFRAQQAYGDGQQQGPTIEQMAEADRLYRLTYSLQLLMTPLATGALTCGLAITAVLGRRWQLREAAGITPQAPAR
jgi:hypothetical protein